MSTEKPTPPEGYEVMLGKDMPKPLPKNFYCHQCDMWSRRDSFVYKEHPSENPAMREFWYAVPTAARKAPSFDPGPDFPQDHLRAIGGQVPIPLPTGLKVWGEDLGWLTTAYENPVVPTSSLNKWHCWPGKMPGPSGTDPKEPHCKWCNGPCEGSTAKGCKGPPGPPGPTDPKKAAGEQKPQLQLIPPALNRELAIALTLGAGKYGPWNWRENQVEVMTYLGAMRRHIDCFMNGEDIDPESRAHHLGHAAACCAIVLDARQHGTLVDNRPPRKQTA